MASGMKAVPKISGNVKRSYMAEMGGYAVTRYEGKYSCLINSSANSNHNAPRAEMTKKV